MITASNLLFRIGILTPTVTRDEYGAQVTSYALTRTVAADVKYNKGKRILEHGEFWMPTTIGITTRLHPDLTEHCRIVWDGKTPYV
jgi:head-tail adaptor